MVVNVERHDEVLWKAVENIIMLDEAGLDHTFAVVTAAAVVAAAAADAIILIYK